MTDRSDRAGGDGLLNDAKIVRQFLRDGINHNRAENALDRIMGSLRASPPSGNAGEGMEPVAACSTCSGVGLVGGFVVPESGYQDEPCPDCTPAAASPAASPQPAPNAVREALKETAKRGYTKWLRSKDRVDAEKLFEEIADAILSTPSPVR